MWRRENSIGEGMRSRNLHRLGVSSGLEAWDWGLDNGVPFPSAVRSNSALTNPLILATKLHASRPQAGLVPRPTLQESLDEIPRRRLTVISAPAGFGKTTTVGKWIAEHDYPVAWVSLDAGDNDPQRFLSYLLAAIRTIHPDIDVPILAPPAPPLSVQTGILVNQLASKSDDYLLVFDDYHVISDGEVHDAVTFLLEHAPPSLHLVMTTRSDPPFPLARLRVRGELVELRAADLRFSSSEIACFFNEVMRLDLGDNHLRLLAEKTEGWAAGLQMAAISLRGRDDVASFLAEFSGADRYVLDYLLEEVLGRLDSPFQQALMALSVVDRFNGSLLEALVDGGSGTRLLEDLERNNLFLIPLDNHREWYRFHHLFGDLLHHRLASLYPARLADLHRRAADWYAGENMPEIALTHYREANDREGFIRTVDQHWRRLVGNSMTDTLYEDVHAIPPTLRTPRIAIVLAWSMLHVNLTEGVAELVAKAMEELGGDEGEDVSDARGHAEAILALAARNRANPEEMIRHGERALSFIPDRHPDDADYIWLVSHGILRSLIGDAWHALGDITPALEAFEKAIAIGRFANDLRTIQVGSVNRGRELMLAGRLAEALEQLNEIDALVESSGGALNPLVLEQQWYSRIHLMRGEYAEARSYLERGIALDSSRIGYRAEGHRLGALIGFLSEDRCYAEEHLRAIDGLPTIGGQERFSVVGPALRAEIALCENDLASIERWTTYFAPEGEAHRVQRRAFNAMQREHGLYGRGRSRLGRPEEALEILEEVDGEYRKRGNLADRLSVTLGRVGALDRMGKEVEAENLLEEAMAICAVERIILPFVMGRHEARGALERLDQRRMALDQRITPAWMATVMKACGLLGVSETTTSSSGATVSNTSPQLTGRESEILALMAMGLSNQKIADRLYLSVNTIKTHASNLFDKLGASSRVEALVKAKEMRMLE